MTHDETAGVDGLDAVAARDLAVQQRETLRSALADLVDAVAVALSGGPDSDPGEALAGLDRPHRDANRVLLDTPHRSQDPDLSRYMIERWPATWCGAAPRHAPHVGGPVTEPWRCRGYDAPG